MNRAAVFTISDSRSAGAGVDESGPAAVEALPLFDAQCIHRGVIPDERPVIEHSLREWAARVDLIITTGGTGVSNRDVTPEAAAAVIDRSLPGFGEVMRVRTFEQTPLSIISRGGAGIIGRALIIYLPGSPRAVRDCLPLVAPAAKHVLKVLRQGGIDCKADRQQAATGA